jgi:DNA polymerase-4
MIFHIDIDAFFASAEQAADPSLKNRPMAVGSRSNLEIFARKREGVRLMNDNSGAFVAPVFYTDKVRGFEEYFVDTVGTYKKIRGIITSASYEARDCGVKTGMPVAQALRLCPRMIVIPANYRRYHTLSMNLHRFLQRRIPLVEQYSIDEFFADASGWIADEKSVRFAAKLQYDIKKAFDLPVSIGICRAKWIAKLATEYAKPFGIYYVDDIETFIEDIPIEAFPGIGKGFARRLREAHIKTLGELRRSRALLYRWKKPGRRLYARVTGTDGEGVDMTKPPRKSIGISRTFDPIDDVEEIRRRLMVMARHIAYMAESLGVCPTRYHLRIKYADGSRFKRSATRTGPFCESKLKTIISEIYVKYAPKERKVIKLALSVSSFAVSLKCTPSLFEADNARTNGHIDRAVGILREKFGLDIVKTGNELI